LDTGSKSALLAAQAQAELEREGATAYLLDLRRLQLPSFDNGSAFDGDAFERVHSLVDEADSVVIAMPIYNWGPGSSAKNFIELTGATGENGHRAAWFDKVVTFLCAGGLPHSYMAYSQLASSMMLDFKCIVNPYMVYATDRDLNADGEFSESVSTRLTKTMAVHTELRDLLRDRIYRSAWEI
jgi:NAD(P)H-dependent FMN reductase